MKIRIGFVSNSSSASFILHTDFNKEEVINILHKELPSLFNRENFKKELEESLELKLNKRKEYEQKKQLKKEGKDVGCDLYDIWLPQVQDRIKFIKKALKDIDKIKEDELIAYICQYYQSPIGINEMDKICFSGWTTIWNGEESMGEFLTTIRNMFLEKYPKKSMVEVQNDY